MRGSHPCKSRRCEVCGVTWAGDQRRKLLANVSAYGGDVALITATAPGSQALPDREAMWRWNRSAPARWRALHREASQIARRRCGTFSLLASSWEYQARGALHKHALLGMATPRERRAAHVYLLAVDELRHKHGFGFVSDSGRGPTWRKQGLKTIVAEQAARYLAKYLSPLAGDGKPTLSETVRREDVPAHVVYVARALTAKTGVTMRWLRWCRFAWALGIDARTGEVLRASLVAPLGLHEELSDVFPSRGP